MNIVLQIALFFFLSNDIFAKCGPRILTFWPAGNTLVQNPLIIIEGDSDDRQMFNELNSKYRIFLQTNDHRVALRLQEVFLGQFNEAQAILKPEKPLEIGKEYQLRIEKMLGFSRFPLYTTVEIWKYSTANKREDVKWTVIAGVDTNAPQWIRKPKEINSRVRLWPSELCKL